MPTTIQFRRGTLSQWTGVNPILASGEPGLDLTNMLLKVGDGSRNWNNLPYVSVRLSGGTGIGLSQNPDGSYTISSPLSISGIGLSRTYNNSPSGNYTLSLSTGLQSIANLNIPTNNYLYTTGPNTFTTGLITSAGRSLLASNGHTHSVSDITNFGSGVSGLFPTGTVNYIPKFGNGGRGLNNSVIVQSGNFIGIGINPENNVDLKINNTIKAYRATFNALYTNPATFTDEDRIFIHSNGINNSNGINIDTEIGYANFYDKLFIDSYNPIVNISGNLNINGTGVSLSGHTHGLKIGDGSADKISYLSSDRLNVVGTGGTSISFDDNSNTITISGAVNLSNVVFTTGNQNISGVKTFKDSVSAPTGNWNYLVSTGNILTNFVTPTNIKFKYDNMGIDDITTVDELLKRLVDKALYTQVIASISNNKGTTIQPGTVVSNATYTVSTSAGALSTGYISGTLIPTTYINSVGSYPINFTNSLNSGQNQSYTYTLSYNDTKRVAAGSSFLSTTTSIRFIDFKYYGLSRSGDLNNCGNQTNLQNSFITYSKDQSLNRSLSYTYTATDTNQYYLWYIIPSGGFTQYSLDNNFIPSSNVSVGGFADSNWKFIGAYNLINTQNYTHPYYFYRYDTIQVGTFTIPVVFN